MIYDAYGCDPNNSAERASTVLLALSRHATTSLFIEPASVCNLKCRFCDFHSNHDQVFNKQKGIMSMATFNQVMENVLSLPFKFKVSYFNLLGEPLLNSNLANMIHIARSNDIAERYSISTNGILLTDSVLQELIKAGTDTFIVNLDTARINRYKEFKGSDKLDIVLDNIFNAIEVISSQKRFISLNIKCTHQSGSYGITEEDTESVLLLFRKYAENSDRIHIYCLKEFNWYTEAKEAKLKADHRLCDQPFFQVAIHHDGTVSWCCMDINFDMKLGKLASKDSLSEMLQSGKLRAIRNIHLSGNLDSLPVCKYCEVRPATDLHKFKEEVLQLI